MRVLISPSLHSRNNSDILFKKHNQKNRVSDTNLQKTTTDNFDRISPYKVNNSHSLVFKSNNLKIIEPMNFKTNSTFIMLKELFEMKSKILAEDLLKFKEFLVKEYSKPEISIPIPLLATSSEAYGCEFLLLRDIVENDSKYMMFIMSDNQIETVEFKDGNLIADFNPKEKGLTLNEYVLIGLESQMANIKIQEKLDKLEADYQLRDSKVTEYVDGGLSNIQIQIDNLKKQIDKNTTDIELLKGDIKCIDENIKNLRNELRNTTTLLNDKIRTLNSKNIEKMSRLEKRIEELASRASSGGSAGWTLPPSESLFRYLVAGEKVKYVN